MPIARSSTRLVGTDAEITLVEATAASAKSRRLAKSLGTAVTNMVREQEAEPISSRRDQMRSARDLQVQDAHRIIRLAGWLNASDRYQRRMTSLATVKSARIRVIAAKTCDVLLKSMCSDDDFHEYEDIVVDGETHSFSKACEVLDSEIGTLCRFLALTEVVAVALPLPMVRRPDPDDDIPF